MCLIHSIPYLLLAAVSCFGEAAIVGPKSAKYDDVTITIGMTRAAVLEAFDASKAVVLTKMSENHYGVYMKDLAYVTQPLGSVHFQQGSVKTLAVNDGDPAVGREAQVLFNNIYDGVRKLKSSRCRVDAFVGPDPSTKTFKLILYCGAEVMQITSMTIEEHTTIGVSRAIQ